MGYTEPELCPTVWYIYRIHWGIDTRHSIDRNHCDIDRAFLANNNL